MVDRFVAWLLDLFGIAREVKAEKDRAESEDLHTAAQAENEEARAREAARTPPPLPPDARRPR